MHRSFPAAAEGAPPDRTRQRMPWPGRVRTRAGPAMSEQSEDGSLQDVRSSVGVAEGSPPDSNCAPAASAYRAAACHASPSIPAQTPRLAPGPLDAEAPMASSANPGASNASLSQSGGTGSRMHRGKHRAPGEPRSALASDALRSPAVSAQRAHARSVLAMHAPTPRPAPRHR
jgi:hypothetical protein